ncbi:MAG: hypothetical protein IKE01_03380 [Clostridia bacterium]|nr:hypothetical protein [Clostridia bacterium]
MERGKVPTDKGYRERVNDSILNNLKRKIFEYLVKLDIPNSQVFWQNMQKVSGLYVESLIETQGAKMISRGMQRDSKTRTNT